MTTLVAVAVPAGVWIGADSALTDNDRRCPELEPFAKWDFVEGWALGFAGCPVTAQAAIVAMPEIKKMLKKDKPGALLGTRQILLEAYKKWDVEPGEKGWKANGMLAGDGKLWEVGSNGLFLPGVPGKFFAAGSGADVAFGAWQAQEGQLLSPDGRQPRGRYYERLLRCLEAAKHYDIYTGSELWVKFLPAKDA